jgi:hypothetical protein
VINLYLFRDRTRRARGHGNVISDVPGSALTRRSALRFLSGERWKQAKLSQIPIRERSMDSIPASNEPEMALTPTPLSSQRCVFLSFMAVSMQLTVFRRLPLEVIETIMDHLHDDRKALETCSLVCKALTPRAQFRLFFNITLNLRHCDDLVQLTQSASTVVQFIRHLHLDCHHMNAFDINLQLPVGFKAIESLTVSDLRIRHFDSQRISSFFINTSITNATVLRLIDIGSRYVFQLAHIICAFPRLQKLAISVTNNYSWIDDILIPTGLQPSPHLTALQLGYLCLDGMLKWLMSLPACPALRTVSLWPSFSNDLWMEFLLLLRDSLEFLCLDIGKLSSFANPMNFNKRHQDPIDRSIYITTNAYAPSSSRSTAPTGQCQSCPNYLRNWTRSCSIFCSPFTSTPFLMD